MLSVQIEHPIKDYAGWRAAFEGDPNYVIVWLLKLHFKPEQP